MSTLRSPVGLMRDWVTPGCAEGDRETIEADLALHADDRPVVSRFRGALGGARGWRRPAMIVVATALGFALGRMTYRRSRVSA